MVRYFCFSAVKNKGDVEIESLNPEQLDRLPAKNR